MGRVRIPIFADQPWRSLVILGLYGYQGLVAGFGLNALPNLNAAQGASPAAIGAYLAMVGLPWTLQPLWGPVVDRFGGARMGPRRAWIVAGLAGALCCLGLLAAAGSEAPLHRIGLILLLHSAFASLVDTATDGMIIDRVPLDQLGRATAQTRIGFACGTALGASVFAWAIPALGLPTATLLLIALAATAAMPVLLVREAPEDALLSRRTRSRAGVLPAEGSFRHLVSDLLAALRRRDAVMLIALCLCLEFAAGAFGVRLAVGMVQAGGWEAESVSRLQAALALAGGTVGALAVGWWSDRIGHLRALAVLLAACSAAHLTAALLLSGAEEFGTPAGWALALSGVAPALVFVALAPAVMQASRGRAAATRFALYMAAVNLGGVAGAAASGPLGSVMGPWQLALLAAIVFAVGSVAAARPGLLFAEEHAAPALRSEADTATPTAKDALRR